MVVTRRRHPLEGQTLAVLGRMRRHGTVELLVVLADGSKTLLPGSWTDMGISDGAGHVAGEPSTVTLGSLGDLLAASELLAALAVRPGRPERGRLHGDHRARRTTVQPVQLSLTAEAGPTPAPALTGALPPDLLDAATQALGRLIAKASSTTTTNGDSHE